MPWLVTYTFTEAERQADRWTDRQVLANRVAYFRCFSLCLLLCHGIFIIVLDLNLLVKCLGTSQWTMSEEKTGSICPSMASIFSQKIKLGTSKLVSGFSTACRKLEHLCPHPLQIHSSLCSSTGNYGCLQSSL